MLSVNHFMVQTLLTKFTSAKILFAIYDFCAKGKETALRFCWLEPKQHLSSFLFYVKSNIWLDNWKQTFRKMCSIHRQKIAALIFKLIIFYDMSTLWYLHFCEELSWEKTWDDFVFITKDVCFMSHKNGPHLLGL